jgi:hypothetical protein
MSERIVELTQLQRDVPDAPVSLLEGDALALRVREAVSKPVREQWMKGVYAARDQWVADFRAQQFTLGRAWYTHLEQDRTSLYFEKAAEADALVERFAPGLQPHMSQLAEALVGAPVRRRSGWCGPGVHVFPAGLEVSNSGGTVHYDLEGLTAAHRESCRPALSLILMLQSPSRGGSLRIWNASYPAHGEDSEDLPQDWVDVAYDDGVFVALSSYRLHQIRPFEGELDRVSATAHLAYHAGSWEIWF